MTFKTIPNYIILTISWTIGVVFLMIPNLHLQAKVSITPITRDSSGFASSFVYKMEAGQKISDKALLYNLDATDTNVIIQARDALYSDQGVLLSNKPRIVVYLVSGSNLTLTLLLWQEIPM
jgi:hypothetical protein